MFKKISAILTGVAVGLFGTAAAAPLAEVTDVLTDTLSISGEAPYGSYASVLVTNPGYTYEQAIAGDSDAVQYFGGTRVGVSGYSFEFPINGSIGGEFGVYVDVDGEEDSTTLSYYTSSYKIDGIYALNTAEDANDAKKILGETMAIFSFDDDPLYTESDESEIAKAIINIRDTEASGAFSDNLEDLETTVGLLKKALILGALNSGAEEAVIQDGNFAFAAEIGAFNTDEYDDYMNNLSSEGIKNVNKGMLDNDFESCEEAVEKFNELVYFNVLMNYCKNGYGHIQNYFEKYKSAYKAAGFDIPSKADRELYLDMLDLDSKDLDDLADDFNDLRDDNNKGSGKGGTNGGFSGGGSGVGKAPVSQEPEDETITYLPADDKNDTPIVQTPDSDKMFSDVDKAHWAYEAISVLSDRKILNGYENGEFRPDGSISRAEFASLLKRAFELSGEGEAFEDVAKDAWYYDAVAALSAKGIINGSDGKFLPENSITREDAAVIIYRHLGVEPAGNVEFADADSVSDYAKDAVATLSSLGVLSGYEDGTFRPQGTISRAEAAKILYTYISKS